MAKAAEFDKRAEILTKELKTMSDKEVLVVASKVKNYIKSNASMNTSATVMEALSNKVRNLCNDAISRAQQDGRKTVMDRDFG